jgi:hypothetical protein
MERWALLALGAPLIMEAALVVVGGCLALGERIAKELDKPRRLASGGTGSCVAVPSTEVE